MTQRGGSQKGAAFVRWNFPETSPDSLMLSGFNPLTGVPERSSNFVRSARVTIGLVVKK
jgi:hypothetical protein